MKFWIRKIIAVMLTFVMIVSAFSVSGLALTSGHDNPLTVEIIAKDSYSLMETGSITVKVTNTGKTDLNNVVITADSGDLLFLNRNGQKSYSVGKLEKGKSAAWTVQVILSSNCNGLGFFQRILLTIKKWFTPCSAFSKGYNNDKQAVSLANKQINYAGITTNLMAYAFYDSTSIIVNADDIASFSSAVSNLIKEQMKDDSFDSYVAEQNDFYSGRILLKGKNVDLESCDAETIIAGPDDTYIIQFDSPAKAIAFQAEQNGKANIEFAEPDTFVRIDPIERTAGVYDSLYASSTFNSWGVEHIEANVFANYLSNNNYTSEIVVAVVDSGVDNTHPYLAGKLVSGYDYVDNDGTPYEDYHGSGHGTHVSGTIIDCTPGLNVKIMPVRVLGLEGNGYTSAVASGIKYAASYGAKIINLSLGGKHNGLIEDAIDYAINQGATVCVAAGNDKDNTAYHCPSHITTSGCICVSAITYSNAKASFSNYGNAVDVAAPGVSIKSCVPGGLYKSWHGTSMATPHVSACAAMIKLLNPSASPSQIESYIRQYTQDIGTSGRDNYFGYGVPKMSKAIPKTNYTVTYNANGGSVSPASSTVESGRSVTLPTPTRSYMITYNANSGTGAPSNQNLNASCKGWSTSSSATSSSYNCGSSYTPMSSITLYAVWGNATGNVTTAKPTRSGYSFAGWSTTSSANTVNYNSGSSISINKNTTLYAVWSKNPNTYTISYNANGGSGAPSSQVKTENINLTLSSTVPTRSGYNFLGWSKNSSATSATYSSGGTYTANESATLYAVWKTKTYTVSYNANGGSGAPSNQTKTHGQNLTLSSTKPTRSGYSFLGWSKNSSATSATYSSGGTYTANESATLYAVWGKKTITLSFYSVNKTCILDANGSTDNLWLFDDGSWGYGVVLPTVTTKYCNSDSNAGWEVVSGSAVYKNVSGYGPCAVISQPGTVIMRYKQDGVYSSNLTINFSVQKKTETVYKIMDSPMGNQTGSLASGQTVNITEWSMVYRDYTWNGNTRNPNLYGYSPNAGGWVYMCGWNK